MKYTLTTLLGITASVLLISCGEKGSEGDSDGTSSGTEQTTFKVAWSPYTGWEPLSYMVESGILEKHAKANGITIKVDKLNDYIESINLYSSGDYDCVSVTNMDALAFPAVQGVDSTFLLPTDFSNGNDGIVTKGISEVKELEGATINLVELSVSHYMLARALQKNGVDEKSLKVVNSSDAQIGSLFEASDKVNVATWNPILNTIKKSPGAKVIFDSSQIPGEIIDTLLVKTKSTPAFKKALADAWYETMEHMQTKPESIKLIADSAGGTLEDFKAQLETTEMFYDKASAAEFVTSDKVKTTMEFVRTFAFDHGLYAEDAENKDVIGIEFPDGSVIGDKSNIKLRFTAEYLK